MMCKNISYNCNKKALFLLQILLPLLICLSGFFSSAAESGDMEKEITINLNQYPKAYSLLESYESEIADQYKIVTTVDSTKFKLVPTEVQTVSEHLLNMDMENRQEINSYYLVGATISDNEITAWYNQLVYHSAPLSLNLVHNAIARYAISDNANIIVKNKPLHRKDFKPTPKALNTNGDDDMENALQHAEEVDNLLRLMNLSLHIFVTMFIFFLVLERVSRAKFIFFISGVNSLTYWITHFIWDAFVLTLAIILLGFLVQNTFVSFQEEIYFLVVLYVATLSAIPLVYIFSLIFNDAANAFGVCMVILLLLDFVFTLVSKYTNPTPVLLFMPIYGFFYNIKRSSEYVTTESSFCVSTSVSYFGKQLCDRYPYCCEKYFPLWEYDVPGVKSELIWMLGTTFALLAFVIIIDCGLFKSLNFGNFCIGGPRTKRCCCDDDVIRENLVILDMKKRDRKQYNLVVDHITKSYYKFLAVDRVSFLVHKYECFGLLGGTAAGKTSVLKMLTGESHITKGDAFVIGHSVKKHVSGIKKHISYCPQFDALLAFFTGRQTLRIFCTLRGIQRRYQKHYIKNMASLFGISKHLNQRVKNYSCGNKRKLSAAIAMIGAPDIIYLDEPTVGIDPAARRIIWNMVNRMRNAGSSIVLTSNSMEECEALCTRLAIIVRGIMRCIGSVQHLKSKFSKIVIVKLKIEDISLDEFNEGYAISRAKNFIIKEFPNAQLHGDYNSLITFYIPLTDRKWSDILETIQTNTEKYNIKDFSITQTSLEEISLEFATTRSPKICTCKY